MTHEVSLNHAGRSGERTHARTRGLARGFIAAAAPAFAALALAACGTDSPSEPAPTPTAEVGVIVNSQDHSLSVFSVDEPQSVTTIGLGPDGSPVTVAARGAIAVIPLGTFPAAAVVDLRTAAVVDTVGLPEGSGATGVAFLNDSIALVANSGRNSVSPIHVGRGEPGEELAVGGYPQAIVAVEDTAWVLNAELGDDFQPTGPGTISLVAGDPLQVVRTDTLSATNPGSGIVGPDGRLYIVNSGRFGEGEGSVSVVDRATLEEVAHIDGFGDFPGSIAIDADGRAYVGSFAYGMAVWDTQTREFIRDPSEAVEPGGIPSTSGIAIDSEGRLYALEPNCSEPGTAYRLSASYEVEETILSGICPLAIVFTSVPAPDA